jgi:hypothetical protein
MQAYSSPAGEHKTLVLLHVPSPRWSLAARLAQTWWRNPNARGIAEPDPRTVAPGRRGARSLRSPCPWSRRRVKRERKLQAYRADVGPMLARLAALANVWPDPERPRDLARALTGAEARGSWLVPDPTWTGRTYERATPFLLPRRADQDATRFIDAYQEARRFLNFADLQLRRERDARLGPLLASLRPSARPEGQPITRRPNDGKDTSSYVQLLTGTEEWRAVAARLGARVFGEPPHQAM